MEFSEAKGADEAGEGADGDGTRGGDGQVGDGPDGHAAGQCRVLDVDRSKLGVAEPVGDDESGDRGAEEREDCLGESQLRLRSARFDVARDEGRPVQPEESRADE